MVAQTAVRRRLIKASSGITQLGYDESTTTQELLEKAEAELFSVSDQSLKQDLVSLESILTDSFDRIEELHRNKGSLRGMRTGYRDLDAMTAGLQKSDLIILAARPAMGKTALVTNLAYNVATIEKKPVLFFSLEMSKECAGASRGSPSRRSPSTPSRRAGTSTPRPSASLDRKSVV